MISCIPMSRTTGIAFHQLIPNVNEICSRHTNHEKTIRYINVIPTQNITYRIIINHANEHSSFAWLLYEYQSVFKLACQGINLSASMNTTHGILCNKKHRKHRNMMTSSNGNIFRVTGHLCGEFTGPRWIPHTKASVTELWCFLWSASE